MSHIILQSGQTRRNWCGVCFVTCVLVSAVMILASCVSLQVPSTLTPTAYTSPTVSSLPLSEPSSLPKQPPTEDWPTRWLRGIPCRPPCWEGVTPGSTTANEAVEILKNSPVIAAAQMTTTKLLPDLGYVIWDWVGGGRGGQANFHAQTYPQTIYIITPYLPRVRLRDVLEAYGEPSHVIARAFHGPDAGSGIFYDIAIVYRSQGFLLGNGGSEKPVLTTAMPVKVVFFAPTNEAFAAALGGAAAHPEWLAPWQGIRDFGFYCKDNEDGKACR